MKAIVLLSVLALPAAAATPAPAPGGRVVGIPLCKPEGVVRTARDSAPARPRRLNEEPPANLVLAVVRTRGGCMEPVLVREGIGAAP